MARIVHATRAHSAMPMKSSTPLGAALAYLGVDGAIPLFHGSQGCTSFALVLMVRHFKESIPLQTTAMNEVSTILGGADHVEEAILNLKNRVKPRLIGIASTALTETRGEDMAGDLRLIKERRREEIGDTRIVYASTPDFDGAIEDGWSRAVSALIDGLVAPRNPRLVTLRQINILAGVHQTPGDIDEIRDIVEAFGLKPIIVPDISGSLDGHVPETWVGTSLGGAKVEDIERMGRSMHTIAIGEHMRGPARKLEERTGVDFTLFPSLTGLEANDRLMVLLSSLSGKSVPTRLKRRRSQLVDAMMDCHFYFGGKKVAIGADPDLLCALAGVFTGLGAELVAAVSTTGNSPLLAGLPCAEVEIGDIQSLEDRAAAGGAELLVTNAHGRMSADKLGIPLWRVGFPIFDRLGSAHRVSVGYAGTRDLLFEIANVFIGAMHAHRPEDFLPEPLLTTTTDAILGGHGHARAPAQAH